MLNDVTLQPELIPLQEYFVLKREKDLWDPTSCPRIVFRGAHIRDAHVPV